jgi:hypothetical protein
MQSISQQINQIRCAVFSLQPCQSLPILQKIQNIHKYISYVYVLYIYMCYDEDHNFLSNGPGLSLVPTLLIWIIVRRHLRLVQETYSHNISY